MTVQIQIPQKFAYKSRFGKIKQGNSSLYNNGTKRSRMEIIAEILLACNKQKAKTNIMYETNLNCAQLKTHLTFLAAQDMLSVTSGNTRQQRKETDFLNFSWVFKISLPQNEYSCVHRFSTLPSIFLEARAQHDTRLQNPRMIRVQHELIIDGSGCVPYVCAGEVAFFYDSVNFPPDLIQLQVHKLKSQSPIARRKASPTSGLCFANTSSLILIIRYGARLQLNQLKRRLQRSCG